MSRSGPFLDREGQEGHQNYPIVFKMASCLTLWIRTSILDCNFLFISRLSVLQAVKEISKKKQVRFPSIFFFLCSMVVTEGGERERVGRLDWSGDRFGVGLSR